MAKALLLVHLSLLFASCFTVYGQDLDTVSTVAMPPHQHHSVTPAMAPSHNNHHHHKHSHPPTAAPPAHAPSHHHHHKHSHPPAHAPVHTPIHAPAHAPAHHPPSHAGAAPTPSHHFIRSLVEVHGVVYCKSCKYAGADTLLGAAPVLGATVKLECNNTKYPLNVVSKTDKNGYFKIKAPKTITSYGAHKCKVFLVSSPSASCNKPSTLHGGATGAALKPVSLSSTKPPVALYSVGPFAFQPKCPH